MTPALRVRYATRLLGRTVSLSAIPETWIASAGNPEGRKLWLGGKGVNLLTGPDLEAAFQVSGGDGGAHGVWVQFEAEAGVRHLLVCDLSGPARWDLVVDTRTRTSLSEAGETRGIALVEARPAASYQRLLLVLARPVQTGPAASVMELVRGCEVTPVR